ncbi:MAG TPA: hypothetical protein VMS75_03880 [Terriglobales bacterium]|nr:hypothetical protein [Terriglobales bacterium]
MKSVKFLGLILAAVAVLAAPAVAQVIMLQGTNAYPYDVAQVQAAVSNPYTKVILSGTFNFGTDGSVVISVPGITLQGATTGATIVGGRNPLKTLQTGEYPPAQTSGAKNLTIRNLRFEGWIGFAIYVMGIYAPDNFTLIENNTLVSTLDWSVGYIYGIHYCHSYGSAVIRNNLIRNVSWLAISTDGLNLGAKDSYRVYHNRIEDCHQDAISIGISDPFGLDPNLPINKGPVVIEDNFIQIASQELWPGYTWGIDLGADWLLGTSNAQVINNTIKGNDFYMGIFAPWYGSKRQILSNDLTGATSRGTQICDNGGTQDLIAFNRLGPVSFAMAQEAGDPYFGTPIALWSSQPDPSYPVIVPTTNNVLVGNDCRLTGRPGWEFDTAGTLLDTGCVILASATDVYFPDWYESDVTRNMVLEAGMFPRGAGGSRSQVLELPVHAYGNYILGGGFTLGIQANALSSLASVKANAAAVNLRQAVNAKRAALQSNVESCKKRKQ